MPQSVIHVRICNLIAGNVGAVNFSLANETKKHQISREQQKISCLRKVFNIQFVAVTINENCFNDEMIYEMDHI